MNKIMSGLLATVLSVSFAGTAAVPAGAATMYLPQQSPASSSDVINVAGRGDGARQSRNEIYRRNMHRNHHGNYRYNNGNYRHNGGPYWRGHRGYSHYRPGYRRHGDFWFPLAAFATGAIISGAIANDRPPVYGGNAHVRWCYDHYRSYRASDNSWQPYNGPRRQCVSPY